MRRGGVKKRRAWPLSVKRGVVAKWAALEGEGHTYRTAAEVISREMGEDVAAENLKRWVRFRVS